VSLANKQIDAAEWARQLTEQYGNGVPTFAFARHFIRALPWRKNHNLTPFNDSDLADTLSEILPDMRAAIIAACYSWFADHELEAAFLNFGPSVSDILEHSTLFLGEAELQRDLDDELIEQNELSTFLKPLFRKQYLTFEGNRFDEVKGELANTALLFLKATTIRPEWAFWKEWYQGFLEGAPIDWRLQRQVALIHNSIWHDGPEAIAAEIERIQAEFGNTKDLPRPENVPELERSKLLQHVKMLLASSDMTALAAKGAAEVLDSAIQQYLNDAPANCLPDGLIHLEGLPSLFRSISATVKSNQKAKVKEEKLADEIEALNAKITQLEASLKAARGKTVNGMFFQSALKAAGAAFGAGVVGSLGLGLAHFFGEWPSDLTLENFRGYLSDLKAAEPAALPPATNI
jgi:hypothetical protein